jgi:hypothetical protein
MQERPAFPENIHLREGERPCGFCGQGRHWHRGRQGHDYLPPRYQRWKDQRPRAVQWAAVRREAADLWANLRARWKGDGMAESDRNDEAVTMTHELLHQITDQLLTARRTRDAAQAEATRQTLRQREFAATFDRLEAHLDERVKALVLNGRLGNPEAHARLDEVRQVLDILLAPDDRRRQHPLGFLYPYVVS